MYIYKQVDYAIDQRGIVDHADISDEGVGRWWREWCCKDVGVAILEGWVLFRISFCWISTAAAAAAAVLVMIAKEGSTDVEEGGGWPSLRWWETVGNTDGTGAVAVVEDEDDEDDVDNEEVCVVEVWDKGGDI